MSSEYRDSMGCRHCTAVPLTKKSKRNKEEIFEGRRKLKGQLNYENPQGIFNILATDVKEKKRRYRGKETKVAGKRKLQQNNT